MPTQTDLQRGFGRMEGELSAMKHRLDRIERVVDRIDARMANIEAEANRSKGAWKVAMVIAGTVGALVSAIGSLAVKLLV